MRYSRSLPAALFAVLALSVTVSAAQAQALTIALPDEAAAAEVSLPSDFTAAGSGGVGAQADPAGGGMVLQLLPASDTGISNAPSNFHYTRTAGH